MKKDTVLVIFKMMILFITSILIFLTAFFQYTGIGILFKANNENRIENFIFSDITGNKEMNPEAIIQNNSGIQLPLDNSNTTVNVIEIDVAEIDPADIDPAGIDLVENAYKKIKARVYYRFDEKFTTPNSIVLDMREGKNYIALNKNNLKELYFDFPMDKIKINAITINPDYSIVEIIRNWVPIIAINFLVLLFSFFILDGNFMFRKEKLFIGYKILTIVLLFYYNKFFIILGAASNSYIKGFAFLAIILLVLIFLKITSKEDMGEINVV